MLLTDADSARHSLSVLVAAGLLEVSDGRYTVPALLRVHGRRLAAAADLESDRQAALAQVLEHYLSTAAAAINRLRSAGDPDGAQPAGARVTEAQAARRWLDAERANLAAVIATAAARGWPAPV